jgi:hypothetical protein
VCACTHTHTRINTGTLTYIGAWEIAEESIDNEFVHLLDIHHGLLYGDPHMGLRGLLYVTLLFASHNTITASESTVTNLTEEM